MVDVEEHSPFRNELSPTMVEMFRRLAPNMIFPMRLVMANLWLFRPLLNMVLPLVSSAVGAMMHTTIAFTTAKGSDGLNVLPQTAYVTGNMRLIHHQPGPESLTAIGAMAAKYNIETEVLYQDEPCPVVAYDSPQFRLVEEVAGQVYPGVQVSPYVMTGGTDAKFFKEICPNCIRFAPLYIDEQQYGSIHGLNENIHQGALAHGVAFYRRIILGAGKISASE
jgi:carboxypeptidase PM20D1